MLVELEWATELKIDARGFRNVTISTAPKIYESDLVSLGIEV
jgi:hypothetical protein